MYICPIIEYAQKGRNFSLAQCGFLVSIGTLRSQMHAVVFNGTLEQVLNLIGTLCLCDFWRPARRPQELRHCWHGSACLDNGNRWRGHT
jgi:hypothetical protein